MTDPSPADPSHSHLHPLTRRRALALSLGGLASLIVPAGPARAADAATGPTSDLMPAPPGGVAGAPPRPGGLSADVSTGPVDIHFEVVGPRWTADYEPGHFIDGMNAIRSAHGAANRDPMGEMGPGTVKLANYRIVTESAGSAPEADPGPGHSPWRRRFYYDFIYRKDGWPDLERADFDALFPRGIPPQDVYARGEPAIPLGRFGA